MWETILSHLPTIIIGILILVDFILNLVKNKNLGFLEIMAIVEDQVEIFMVDAENIKGLDGKAKKDYVIDKIVEFLKENNISFPVKEINSIIEKVIDLTKKINK